MRPKNLSRSAQQLAAETAALTKTVDEKNAAVPPMTEAWNSTKPTVEAAKTKVTPLATSFKTAEQTMRAARTQAEADAEALVALDRRLATARQMSQLTELPRAVAAAKEAVPARESELAAAQKQVADFAATVAEIEAKGKAANETITALTSSSNGRDGRARQTGRSGQCDRRRRQLVGSRPSKSAGGRRARRSCKETARSCE